MKSSVVHVLLLLVNMVVGGMGLGFSCKAEGRKCDALVTYVTYNNKTKLSEIASLFQLEDYRSLLGANAWELSVPENESLPAGYIVKVPITCGCKNGIGISLDKPIYTVKNSDWLSTIAQNVFGGLVVYQDIAEVNHIRDANVIKAGQKFRIPLPCRCDEMGSNMHYAYIVQPGDTADLIASKFGTSETEIASLNSDNIENVSSLIAGQTMDISLKACSSRMSKSSLDSGLIVANGSYAITAKDCVQCSCGSKDLELYCAPAHPSAHCSSMKCKNSNLKIGNMTTEQTSGGCNVTTCSYAGYTNHTILTSLGKSLQSRCPDKPSLPILTKPNSKALPPPPPHVKSPSKSPPPGVPSTTGDVPPVGVTKNNTIPVTPPISSQPRSYGWHPLLLGLLFLAFNNI